MDVKSRNGEKCRNFFELFGQPCRNVLADLVDLDGSTPECAQVCALRIEPHLATLRKIEMVAVLCTNETTPHFCEFLTPPSPPSSRGRWTPEGEGHVGRHCPYTNKIWCGSVHALLRYRPKTAKMPKFPIDSNSNENFISPLFRPRESLTRKRGEDTSGTRVRPHANFGVNRPSGCQEIVDRTKKTKNI